MTAEEQLKFCKDLIKELYDMCKPETGAEGEIPQIIVEAYKKINHNKEGKQIMINTIMAIALWCQNPIGIEAKPGYIYFCKMRLLHCSRTKKLRTCIEEMVKS